jgi:hypothetical protein
MPSSDMPSSDSWKEQLTLISGNILILGVALLKLWPLAARLQTSENVHYFSQFGPRDGTMVFKTLTDVMGIAVAVVALAMLHILCRGLWLASSEEAVKRILDRICVFTFTLAVFIIILMLLGIVVGIPIMFAAMGSASLLLSYGHMSAKAATWIGSLSSALLLWLSLFVLYKICKDRIDLEILRKVLLPIRGFPYFLACVVFVGFGFVVLEGCYTLELTTNTAICHRDRGDIVEIDINLGGATSAPSAVTLKLVNSSAHVLTNLELHEIGEGRYVSYIPSSTLPEGYYRVLLDYPHPSLTLFFPFFRSENHKSSGFLVLSH